MPTLCQDPRLYSILRIVIIRETLNLRRKLFVARRASVSRVSKISGNFASHNLTRRLEEKRTTVFATLLHIEQL